LWVQGLRVVEGLLLGSCDVEHLPILASDDVEIVHGANGARVGRIGDIFTWRRLSGLRRGALLLSKFPNNFQIPLFQNLLQILINSSSTIKLVIFDKNKK